MNMPAHRLNSSITVATLLQGLAEAPEIAISGIASDTRDVGEGFLFLACRGERSHGLEYAAQAIDAGAAAVAYDASTAGSIPEIDAPLIPVDALRSRLGEIANRFYDHPSRSVKVLGYAGTLGYGVDELSGGEGMTTPDVVEFHRRLAVFRDAGAAYAAVEVSSHALTQNRADGVEIDTAVFTNLTRDHLDYHGDMEAYGEAKASLFLEAEPSRRIINVDSEFGSILATRCGPDVVAVSMDQARVDKSLPHLVVRSAAATGNGFDVSVAGSWGESSFRLPLHGEFNVANAALVLAFLLSEDVALEAASAALSAAQAPPGRLQRVDVGTGPDVFVDYAHTPAAVESALRTLRPHCDGALWCVFGCGGDRDAGKRPLMGRAVEEHADRVVVTTDNPRNEDPVKIIEAILGGLEAADAATVIEDRGAAIAWAIGNAATDDVVLLAGKGHENYQYIGGERRDFSDYGAAAANLQARSGRGEGGE
jgi:UDP-N-acetylmuramoyl-L-alanyl-D-glutamate--2,6-diaminopimelate ligase